MLCLTTTCYYLHRWALLFSRNNSVAYLAATVCATLVLLRNGSYCYGGTSDEYVVPFVAALGYYSRLLWQNKSLGTKQWMICGLCIGFIFWNKYTLAVPVCVLIGLTLFLDRESRERVCLLQALGGSLLGFMLVTAPVLAYFAWNGALGYLYYGYYLFHVLYHSPGNLIYNIAFAVIMHPLPFLVLFIGCAAMAFRHERYKYGYLCSCAVMLVCIYMSASFQYYFLPLLPFCLYGAVWLQERENKMALLCRVACVALLLISSSTIRIKELESYKLAELLSRRSELEEIDAYCRRYEDRSLLHAGGFDSGFHIISGSMPTVRYYQRINYNPAGDDAQKHYIEEHRCAFALTRATVADEMIELLQDCGYAECPLPEPQGARCFRLFHYKDAK